MAKFQDKVVVVTGGASGIGASVAEAFQREGATVAVLDIRLPEASARSSAVRYHECDVASETSVEECFDTVLSDLGSVDVLVHCAARVGVSAPFHEVTAEAWNSYIDVNLTGSFLVSRAAASRMVANDTAGRIILIGSVNSFASERNAAPYASSKGGVRLLTRSAAIDLARYGITVNMIAPGPIVTPPLEEKFATPELTRIFDRVMPGGKPGRPGDIASTALFLASPEAAFINGADIVVDGGMLAQILN
ncbi:MULTISPECIES: SDR family NAD(P)-dependent oxidoreductase [Rhizobium]|uniref:SDR family NAD(P)-dependent oxidoreductase n=1 Tax=Rhizobium TaxID=379 RepID=UPI0019565410|nr:MULTISPECIES: SDR family oxidoreductase [Rhizobium]MBM7044085.1 SDR family oxidoreductase [Rhizobium lusitanum]